MKDRTYICPLLTIARQRGTECEGEFCKWYVTDKCAIEYLRMLDYIETDEIAASIEEIADVLREKNAAPVLQHQDGKAEKVVRDHISVSNDTGKGGQLQV